MSPKREAAAYLACGFVSMGVSWAAMIAANYMFFGGTRYPDPVQNSVLGMCNWTSGMLSAYAMNRKLVFRTGEPVRTEFPRFLASRLGTLAMDQALRQLLGALGAGVYAATLAISVLVTVLNYVIGKLAVFRTAGEGGGGRG